MNIVVLGDCASNGNNILGHEIYNDPNITMTFSTQYHMITSDHAVKWYLSNRKKQDSKEKINFTELKKTAVEQFNKKFHIDRHTYQKRYLIDWFLDKTNNPKDNYTQKDLTKLSLKFLKQQQLQYAWPSFLTYDKIYNYSVNGNQYGNYYIQLKNHIKEFGNPDLVLLTDTNLQETNSNFITFKVNGQRYNKLMHEMYLYKNSSDEPLEIIEKRNLIYQTQTSSSKSYRYRKAEKYLCLLEKFLQNKNIKYKFVLFNTDNFCLMTNRDYIDLTEIYKSWYLDSKGNQYLSRENSKKKFDTQPDCAKIVQENIKGLL